MPKPYFQRCFVPILLFTLHATARLLHASRAGIQDLPTRERNERNGVIGVRPRNRFANVDIDGTYYPELENIRQVNIEKIEIAESHTKTAGHGKNNSLWPISAPVKRSAEKEKAKLSCSWHPKNSSLNCHSRISWQQTKNEISENEEKEQFNEIKVSKVNFGKLSSRHQKESTKTLSLDCGLPSDRILHKETKEQKQFVQLFGFGGLEVSKKNGYHYNYYDNDLRRRKNKSNRNGRNLVHSWPQLSKIQVINCPLITSTAAVKKHKYNFDGSENKTVHKKSLLTSLFQSVFGSVNIHIASFTSIITDLDLSNTGTHDKSLFTSSSFGNNKRSSKRLLSLECKSFGSRLRTLNLSENKLSSIDNIFSDALCPTGTFVNLRELRLSYNLLSRLNRDDLRFAPYLEKLFLNNNQIKAVDEAFKIGSRIKVLDLSHNQLSFLRNGIFSSGALKRKQNETLQLSELHLQNNSLRNIPSFGDGNQGATILPHLVLLNLSRNSIAWNGQSSKQLSPFASLPNLVALDLSHNEITRYVKSYCITFMSIIGVLLEVLIMMYSLLIFSISSTACQITCSKAYLPCKC